VRFQVSAETLEGVKTVCLRDSASGAAAHILPQLGGTVWRLALTDGSRDSADGGGAGGGRDARGHHAGRAAAVLEGDAPDELWRNPGFRGRLLVPFNDRIPRGRYRFERQEYELPINDPDTGCAVHGLVYDKPFAEDFREADDAHAVLRLSYRLKPESSPNYPFALLVTARYHLNAEGFELSLGALNEGAGAAPVTLGWHPYVATPGGVDDARITCPAERFVEVDRDLVPTGALPPVSGGPLDYGRPERVGGRELDIALERNGSTRTEAVQTETARTVIERGDDSVILEQSLPPLRYTQLYIPPQRSSIAVEPVSGATDAFNRPELGLRRLEPGERIDGNVSVSRELRPRSRSDQPT
jgi:aldose 1-epimerase